jgi:hypothetical protein
MDLIRALLEALAQIKDPTLFLDERGYQGELKSKLDRILELQIPNDDFASPQVREEYQKRADRHGITLRPDIIVHVPFERGVSPTRKDDNYMVVLLKRSPGRAKALANFRDLETICSALQYPIGVSVNIASSRLWISQLSAEIPSCYTLYEISVELKGGEPSLQVSSRVPGKPGRFVPS